MEYHNRILAIFGRKDCLIKAGWVLALLVATVTVCNIIYYDSFHATVWVPHPPSDMNRLQRSLVANQGTSDGEDHCILHGYRSWQKGVVTEIKPLIQRDCQELFRGSPREIESVRSQLAQWKEEKHPSLHELLSNCSRLAENFVHNFYVSPEELDFPIAYILVVYTNPEQIVRLLKAIYRSHNLYCIHPDAKQGGGFIGIFRMISKCLPNVFVASKLEKVYWGHHSIMDAQLNCMKDLERYGKQRWHYVINLCGRELPLRTNRQIVRSLKAMKGYSYVEADPLSQKFRQQRFTVKQALTRGGTLVNTQQRVGQPPYNISIMKGSNFIAASRSFVHYLFTTRKPYALQWYLRDVFAPEEHFYSSLYCLPKAPGARPPESMEIKMPAVAKQMWVFRGHNSSTECNSMVVHYNCIVTYADLAAVRTFVAGSLFMNKYFMEWDHVAMDCMEEVLVEQNILEHKQDCA